MIKQSTQQPRLFYGWIVALVAAVNGSFNVGMSVFSIGVFILPMQKELGWSDPVFFGALSLRLGLGGLFSFAIGPWVDHKWGPRLMVPIGSLLAGISSIMLRWVDTTFEFYLWFALVGGLAFTFSGPIVHDSVVVKWFVRKRPAALMWSQAGHATGPILFPTALTLLIEAFGWRGAWLWTGIGTLAVLLPLSFLIRTYPEDIGLQPDGAVGQEHDEPPKQTGDDKPEIEGFDRKEVVRMGSFWTLTAALSMVFFAIPSYQSLWIPFLQYSGFSSKTAVAAIFIFGICSFSGRLIWGFLSSRYPVRSLLVIQAIFAAAGIVFVLTVKSKAMLFTWAVYQGLNLAAAFQLNLLITAEYFGRRHIGAIRGLMFPFSTAAAAAGPFMLSYLRSRQGSYNNAFGLLVVVWLAAGIFVFLSRPPRRFGHAAEPSTVITDN